MSATAEPIPTVMVTGGLGFIGSEVLRQLLTAGHVRVINVDCNNYAAAKCTRLMHEIEPADTGWKVTADPLFLTDRNVWINADISDRRRMRSVFEQYRPSTVIHLAASSHVDRSIDSGIADFTCNNVLGTAVLLDEAVRYKKEHNPVLFKFVYVSTDEVYGPLPQMGRKFYEETVPNPSNPYAATKAAAEHLVRSAGKTYGLDYCITRGCNTYGPWQYPEKLIPVVIDNAVNDREIPIYGDGLQSRQWMHVSDHARAIIEVAASSMTEDIVNIASGPDITTNLCLVKKILEVLNKPESLIKFVRDRPAHDRSYRVDNGKLRDWIDWSPEYASILDPGTLRDVVMWYAEGLGRNWVKLTGHDTKERLGLCEKESS